MSRDEAQQRSKPSQPAGKVSAPKSNSDAASRREGKDFGDACISLKIKNVVNEDVTRDGKMAQQTRLTLVVPAGAAVAGNTEGYVEGMPLSPVVWLKSVSSGVATAYIFQFVDKAALDSGSVMMFCAKPPVGSTINGQIVRERDKNGAAIERSETIKTPDGGDKTDTILRINRGLFHGVKEGMVGHVKGYPSLSFKLERGRVFDTHSDIVLNHAGGSVVDVVIYQSHDNRK